MVSGTLKKILIKILKIVGWVTLSIAGLLIAVALIIQIPSVQNKIVQRAVTFLHDKIKTEVRLRHISISFPKTIVLDGVYLEDQSRDTLLYVGSLTVNTDLFALASHRIQLSDVSLDSLTGKIYRSKKDSAFNFNYIVAAFTDTTASIELKDTTSAPWQFSIGDIELTQTHFDYRDPVAGNSLQLSAGKFVVDADEVDFNKSIIHVNDIVLSDVRASFEQETIPVTKQIQDSAQTADKPFPYDLGLSTIKLKNVKADYRHHGLGQVIRLMLEDASLDAKRLDLKNQIIALNEFSLSNAFILYHQLETSTKPATKGKITAATTAHSKPWVLSLGKIDLEKNILQYYDFSKPMLANGVDFNHLWITDLDVNASDMAWDGNESRCDLKHLSFRDRSGFAITNFQSAFRLNDKSLTLKDFIFKTPFSNVVMDVSANSREKITTDFAHAQVELNVKPSVIGLQDAHYFTPSLMANLPIKLSAKEDVSLSTSCKGTLDNLVVDHLSIKALGATELQAAGKIRGLPEIKSAVMDLDFKKFYTTRDDIRKVLPDTLIPKSIALPKWLMLKGKFAGMLNKPVFDAKLTSEFGEVTAKGKANLDSLERKENYRATVSVNKFDLGKLLLQEKTIGVLDLRASINGSGTKLDNLNARADVHVNDFQYNDYHYRDFKLNGTVKKYLFSGDASLNDKNLDFTLTGDLDYNEDIPKYKLQFDLKNADFKALNLTARPLRARLKVNVDLATSDFKVINGNLTIRNVAVFNGKNLYAVDSLLFASLDQQGKSELSIRSDILSGNFKGTLNLFSLPDAIRRHLNHYFSLHDATYDEPVAPQNFEFSLTLRNTDLLTEVLLPALQPFRPGKIEGKFDSSKDLLDMHFDIADIHYAGVNIDSVHFKIESDKKAFTYSFGIRNLWMDTLQIEGLRLSGQVAHDSILTRFTVLDSDEKDKYVIGGVINSVNEGFQFRFVSDELRLNNKAWHTPNDNKLLINKHGLQPYNFSLQNGDEQISLEKQQGQDSTLSIVFKQFNLDNVTNIVEGTTPAGGYVNGDLNISVAKAGAFNSDLIVHQFTIMERQWGDLTLQLGKTSTGPFNIDLRIEGDSAVMKAAGYVVTKNETSEIHFETDITKINLAIVEPLSLGQVKNVSGELVGNVKIDGKTSAPEIDGTLTFNNAKFTPTMVNSAFLLEHETIVVKRSGLTLNHFKILDAKNDVAQIDGTISTTKSSAFDLNLKFNADRFQLLNSSYSNNKLFYGRVGLNMRATVTGTSDLPRVNMTASLTDDSDFTYVVPQSEKGVLEQKGIVVFVDRDAAKDPFLASINPKDTVTSTFKGIELTANVELSDREIFNIVIDPVTGDKLSVKGNSTLTMNIDATGNMDLSGRYEVSSGSYDMSFYKLVKRKFDLEKGGTITWSGDPLNAMLDLRAIYRVETSPMELVSNQIDMSNTAEVNRYRKQLPFLVYLQINGELLTPEISFKLDMPDRERNEMGGTVYAKIQDINTRESDLNKQVFSLLVLKRFMSDNPFESEGGGDVSNAARRSVSKLLTEQLNRLSSNVKGVQLSLDVKSYEDYSTGKGQGQTQLQLGVSKSMLNDRLIVKVSGNVDVEGDQSQQSSFTDYIGDLGLEYKLTEDGRFRVTGFRNSNYDMIDGELIETGAGLIYIKDYDTLRELFKDNAKDH